MQNFEDFGINAQVLRSLREMGFEEPTPVQVRAMPPLLAGKDVVAQALTGTGKTAAYGIPLIEHIDPHFKKIQAVVLSPTRELAIQVEEHLSQLAKYRNLRFLAIYGGQPIERQLRALSRGVHGIVATPGRLMDHMRRGTVNLDEVRVLVLDEADQMLDMGFQEDVEHVLSKLPKERLTALFSATMPNSIMKIVDRYLNDAERILLSGDRALTVPSVDQVFFQVPFPRKIDALCTVLDSRQPERAMVFCATKRMVDEVAERLPMRGYSATAIHGDVTQSGRERALKAFRDGRIDVLIATDVAARGLDVPDVSLVVNFDIPPDPEYYVHRIGRTARSGKAGEAITFVNPREMRELKMIERVTGAHIRRGELPTPRETEERASQQLETRLLETLKGSSWKRYIEVVDSLSVEHDAIEVAAAALALAAEHRGAPRRIHARSESPDASARESNGDGMNQRSAKPRTDHAHPKSQSGAGHWKRKPYGARKSGDRNGKGAR